MNQIEILQYELRELSLGDLTKGLAYQYFKWDIWSTQYIGDRSVWNWIADFSLTEYKETEEDYMVKVVLRLKILVLNNEGWPDEKLGNICIERAAVKMGEIFKVTFSDIQFNTMPPPDSDIWK